MRVLAVQPFLGSYTISSTAGGKDKAALQINQHLVRRGHQVYVLPWPNSQRQIHGRQSERYFDEVRFQITDDGGSAVALPTAYPAGARQMLRNAAAYCWRRITRMAGPSSLSQFHQDAICEKQVALRMALERAEPDVVHVHQAHSDFAEVYRRLGSRAPLILTHHSAGIGEQVDLYDRVVFVSKHQRDQACRRHPGLSERSRIIYYCADPEYHVAAEPAATGGPMYLGLLTSVRKGIDILMEAYAGSPEANRPPLTVVGEGPLRAQYEAMAKERGLNIRFTGRLSATGNARVMSESRLFVMPSRAEGLAIAYLEALCMGLPIIGFPPNVAELGELLGLNVGLAFDTAKQGPQDLAAMIREIISPGTGFDVAHRKELMRRARERFARERFDAEYMRLYEETLASD